jgi:hypothetical protein
MWFTWLACGGDEGRRDGRPDGSTADVHSGEAAEPAPLAELDVASLALGTAGPGEVTTASVELRNAGDAPLAVSAVSVTGDGFGAEAAAGAVAPGEALVVEVTFAPDRAGPHEGTLRLDTDDALHPSLTVALGGEGRSATLEVVPLVEWPTAWVPCVSEVEVSLANTGFEDLVVTWEPPAAPFAVGGDRVRLRPGRAADVAVTVRPTELGAWEVPWVLTSNDPRGTSTVTLRATASEVVATCPD